MIKNPRLIGRIIRFRLTRIPAMDKNVVDIRIEIRAVGDNDTIPELKMFDKNRELVDVTIAKVNE